MVMKKLGLALIIVLLVIFIFIGPWYVVNVLIEKSPSLGCLLGLFFSIPLVYFAIKEGFSDFGDEFGFLKWLIPILMISFSIFMWPLIVYLGLAMVFIFVASIVLNIYLRTISSHPPQPRPLRPITRNPLEFIEKLRRVIEEDEKE